MTDSAEHPTPRSRARLAGALYIPYLLFSLPLALRNAMIVPNDAGATAARILASEGLYRMTVLTDLVAYLCYIALAYLFYTLLRDISRPWAALATLFTLAGCVLLVASTAILALPPLLLDGSAFRGLNVEQRQELALLALQLFGQAYVIALFLFGVQWLIMGPLFARLIPRPIGYWLLVGGIGWIALALATLFGLQLRTILQSIVLPVGGLAEIALGAWLLVRGVDSRRSPVTTALS